MKTREVLTRHGVAFVERDIFKQPLAADEVRALTRLRPARELFSWRSVRARREGWREGQFADEELIRLMAEDPSLIRRPLVRIGETIVAGHAPSALAAALG